MTAKRIEFDSFVDEPQENDSGLASANVYYSTPSTSNRLVVTKISSQLPGFYFDEDDFELSLEFEAWDSLSDEALINFEASLEE